MSFSEVLRPQWRPHSGIKRGVWSLQDEWAFSQFKGNLLCGHKLFIFCAHSSALFHTMKTRIEKNKTNLSAYHLGQFSFSNSPRSRSGRYFGASMEEQFQRMSVKVFWQTFFTSRAAWMMVCMSSRLLLQSWA